MTTAIRYAHREASERLTLNNPAQARKGAVWGCATRVLDGVPEARALNVRDNRESASLRDAITHRSEVSPTLRCACAGLLRVSASGTFQKHDTTNGIGQHRRAMAADQRGGKDRQSTVEG